MCTRARSSTRHGGERRPHPIIEGVTGAQTPDLRMAHRLEPLLRPRSIAVVGATPRAGAVGQRTLLNVREGGFGGPLYAVNPRYEDVLGVPCFASLRDLPQPVEQV